MPQLELDPDFDPGSRRLCADGSCIGVIGTDGKCKVCGLPDRGGASADAAPAGEVDEDQALASEDAADSTAGPGFDPSRKLCVEGSCIGVIGPDGRCTECGRGSD